MIIALNNKCNLTKEEFLTYMTKLNEIQSKHTIILCPSFTNINLYSSNSIHLGAQNVSSYEEGAYTGEISAKQLKKLGVEYCIVGHSERRIYQKETNTDIKYKITHLLQENIRPILCIGESKEERESKMADKVLLQELESALSDLKKEDLNKIIIAYEPIWAIGTGFIPNNDEIEEMFSIIKQKYPDNPVLYGGSVNQNNIEELKKISSIDGYLLGGLSLKINELQTFVNRL